MTVTVDIPLEAEARLAEESQRTGIPIPELAGRLLTERLQSPVEADTSPHGKQKRAPRPGFASDLFAGVDVDALLATPIPGT